MVGAAALTAGVLALGFGLWQGRGAELLAVRQHLSIEQQRADQAQERIEELTREVIESLKGPEPFEPEPPTDELI